MPRLVQSIPRSLGVRVVWDPAPAMALPVEVYAAADVLTPNQTEATSLTGTEVDDVDSAQAAAEALLERGVPVVVVKLGERGVCYATPKECGHVPPYPVEAVDTVAAGAAFGAALAVALAVTRRGAQEAMPRRHEAEALMARS